MPTSYGRIGQIFHFFVDFYKKMRYSNIMNNKNKGKNTMKEQLSIFFGVIFIMSMFGAAGAVETDQWFLATMLIITGLFTGTLTAVLQK